MSKNDVSDVLKHPKEDLFAGLVVFLVALPLCLGIALASNAPLSSGLLAGAIGGIIVTWLSGSKFSVSGPAAGLTLTVASSIVLLGSFEAFLAAVFMAGMIQILFGICRLGFIVSYFPHSVIKGMLAAIGLIIILKQIPHAFGWDHDFLGSEAFKDALGDGNTFSSIVLSLKGFTTGAIIVSVVCASLIWAWGKPWLQKISFLKPIPASLVAVVGGVLANQLLILFAPNLALLPSSGHLVNIPLGGLAGFISELPKPDWSAALNPTTMQVALTLALIASIESLLCVEATDRLDPDKNSSDTNRELVAQGIGNAFCGALGALPITSVIVRSSANIYSGSKSRLSSFVHGVFLIIAVAFLAQFLNQIPIAALAIVLISVGFKLISFDLIKKTVAEGMEQYLPFFVTIVAILLTDLLTGVGIGMVIGLAIVLRMNHHSALTKVEEGGDILIRFAKDVSFAHKPELKKLLAEIPNNSRLILDGTGAQFIDHDIMETLKDFSKNAESRAIKVLFKNFASKRLSIKGVRSGHIQEPFTGQ